MPSPSVVSREDVASLAVASALFRSPREQEAAATIPTTNTTTAVSEQQDDVLVGEETQQRQFAPFHCTLGVRWVGTDMHPYPAQGRKKDGYPTAQISLEKALKAIKKKEKKERREQLQRRRELILSEASSSPFRIANSLQSRLRYQRQLKPYGIVTAIPIYFFIGLIGRSLIRSFWAVLCSKPWAQPVVGPVERLATALLAFIMTNLRVVERFLGRYLPGALGRIFASKQYITF